jgi:hypothetical protein
MLEKRAQRLTKRCLWAACTEAQPYFQTERSNGFFEFLGGAEGDLLAGLDFDRFAGGRVAAHAGGALAHLQNTQADQVARAQPAAVPVIGFLMPQSANDDYKNATVPFLQGLKETGYVEGQNVAVRREPI